MVLAITGPTGSGKSTLGEKIAKHLDRCANIDADHIKHMIVGGFYEDDNNPGGWSYNQWGLVGDSIGLLADNFLKEGYDVIINGYIDEPGWTNIQKHVTITHKILLLPDIDTLGRRDVGRNEDVRMGSEVVAVHHSHFSSNSFFDDFIRLDSTDQSEDETMSTILQIVSNNEGAADESTS